MKTQTNIRNFRITRLIVFASLVLATMSNVKAGDLTGNALIDLEMFMNGQEQLIKYSVPAEIEMIEEAMIMEKLDNQFKMTEAALKYRAPESDEPEFSLGRLNILASSLEAGLKYKAPVDDINQDIQSIEMIFAAMEASLVYNAPDEETELNSVNNDGNILAATK